MLFLVEYESGSYVDANDINWLCVKGGKISFTLKGDSESIFKVTSDKEVCFLNNVSATNNNVCIASIVKL